MVQNQSEIPGPGPLLAPGGTLSVVGWARQPLLDCNLEDVSIYKNWKFWQPMRIKAWDYYAVTTPTHFFSFTISDVGYIGSIFAYVIDFTTNEYHEETLTVPFAKGVSLPRNSIQGDSIFDNGKVRLHFSFLNGKRIVSVRWPDFYNGDLIADLAIEQPPEHESMVITIPIQTHRFYYNRKINCMPTKGSITYQGKRFEMDPQNCLANLDWGRGVWEYNSFWVWSSASGLLQDGRRIGLNMGFGFGDTSKATENCFILDGIIHKLGKIDYTYSNTDFMQPWTMKSDDGRLDLIFSPTFERVAKTDLKVLGSEVHQTFGPYNGYVITDEGERLEIKGLIGWTEEHHARW
jgi:hypothetical protein